MSDFTTDEPTETDPPEPSAAAAGGLANAWTGGEALAGRPDLADATDEVLDEDALLELLAQHES